MFEENEFIGSYNLNFRRCKNNRGNSKYSTLKILLVAGGEIRGGSTFQAEITNQGGGGGRVIV